MSVRVGSLTFDQADDICRSVRGVCPDCVAATFGRCAFGFQHGIPDLDATMDEDEVNNALYGQEEL